jgi:hypothetical protein
MHPNQYTILNIKNYFEIAEEYAILEKQFTNDTLYKKINFWIDMVLYPICLIVSILYFGQTMGIFTVMSIHKTVTKWQAYLHYFLLKSQIEEWKTVVQSTGGPFISTNDSAYHAYVYADGMQRLYNNLFDRRFLSKKGSKSL